MARGLSRQWFCASGGLPSFHSFPLKQRLNSWYLDLLKFVFLEHMHVAAALVASVSDSVRPHRRQPTRFPRPWDSPGKNTGVGCHFLLQCMKVKSERGPFKYACEFLKFM